MTWEKGINLIWKEEKERRKKEREEGGNGEKLHKVFVKIKSVN